VLPECPAVATTEVRQQPSLKLRKTSMAGPWGVLPVFPAATFTEVEEDVMSMAAPLGVLAEVW
jgi:hypothetical protein